MTRFPFIGLCAVALVAAGCSSDDADPISTSSPAPSTTIAVTTSVAVATTVATSAPTTTVATTTVVPSTAPTTAPTTVVPTSTLPPVAMPAVWPAADVVFDQPEDAAADWVSTHFGVGPVLGEFRAGDARSGEIELFAGDENGQAISTARATVLLRRLGPADGWFVIGVVSDGASIASPDAGSSVPAADLTVTGAARGFEATIVVTAQVAGDPARELDRVVTMAGNLDQVAPFEVTLDLSDAASGDTVVVMVQGGTGLETDPGDVAALAITVA